MIDSRLEEIRLDEKRRRPMSPEQMVRFYGDVKDQQPRHKSRILVSLNQILLSLSQLLKFKNPAQTAHPASRRG